MNQSNNSRLNIFNRNPKSTLSIFFLITIAILLNITELILSQSENKMVQIGNSRFVSLNEPIVNGRNTLYNDQEPYSDVFFKTKNDSLKFTTDINGFIELSYLQESKKSIVFLGDGTTANLHLNPKERFSYLTGKFLKISTYNAGYPGNDIIESLNRLIGTILPLKPDYIILMHTINDFKILSENGSYWNSKLDPKVKYFENTENSIEFKELLLLKKLRTDFLEKDSAIVSLSSSSNAFDTTIVFKSYKSALLTFIAVCKDWDITPILMTQPTHFNFTTPKQTINSEDNYFLNKFNSIIIQTANSQSIHYINLDQHISNQDKYFISNLNLNTRGSLFASAIISDSLSVWIY